DEICFLTATELAGLIRRRDVSAREVMEAHLRRIEAVNPGVNAIVTLVAEKALDAADAADAAVARGEALGPLHGLPIAVKDAHRTRGIRTTQGSPIHADDVPDTDELIVEREKQAGAIVLGKTNLPEFGAGSQTFNPVFGPTLNPYDLSRTCGGSSGGSAVALACGMAPLADGSDMGGSLRNPASFCNVVGLRPSPGRVPSWPAQLAWSTLSVDGPMARTTADVALLLSAIAGPDPRSPIALGEPGSRFAAPLDRSFQGTRIAWVHLGLPFEAEVRAVVDAQRPVFEGLGCTVEDEEPDLADADEIFKGIRAWLFEAARGDDYRARRPLKATIVWNVEQGLGLTGPDLGRLETMRTALYERIRLFMTRYDYLVLPVSQVLPFDIDTEFPTQVDGVAMDSYIDWMRSCYLISATGNPAISVPAGFSADGLPVGLQIVGRYNDDWSVLQLAHAFEGATEHGKRRPA
ncbi:MAG TPA: amidase, partial [Candidatus Limnocylindrales bacterium]|nr:amidase [Candidatus Limnocylindrales bacterium]